MSVELNISVSAYPDLNASEESPSEKKLEEFLSLSEEQQQVFLQNRSSRREIEEIISNADQRKVRDKTSGDLLIHRLVRCSSQEGRALALFCLESGVEINVTNQRGETPLFLAIVNKDAPLTQQLVLRGADTQSLMQVALDQESYVCARVLARFVIPTVQLLQTLVSIDDTIDLFEQKLGVLDIWRERGSLKDFEDQLWEDFLEAMGGVFNEPDAASASRLFRYLTHYSMGSSQCEETKQKVVIELIKILQNLDVLGENEEAFLQALEGKSITLTFENYKEISQDKENAHCNRFVHRLLENQAHDTKELYKLCMAISKEESYEKLPLLIDKFHKKVGKMKTCTKEMQKVIASAEMRLKAYQKVLREIDSQNYLTRVLPPQLQKILIPKWIHEGRWDYLAKIIQVNYESTNQPTTGKALYMFAMDKLLLQEGHLYDGMDIGIPPRYLHPALAEVAKDPLFKDAGELFKRLAPLLEEFVMMRASMSHQDLGTVEKTETRILKKLKTMKEGEQLLIPAGSRGHATCLLVEKTDRSHFKMTYYNTGAGTLLYHYSGEKINAFQTFEVISEIPEASLLSLENWRKFMKTKDMKNIQGSYECFQKVLGRVGKREGPSPFQEDYEAKQASGTCATQCLMAYLRHQVMKIAPGTPEEKKAFYKAFKTYIVSEIYKKLLPQTDGFLKDHAEKITEKLKAEQELLEIAKNPHSFEDAKGQLVSRLEEVGLTQEAKALKGQGSSSVMGRYGILREASKVLADCYLKRSEHSNLELLKSNLALSLVLARFQHRAAILSRIRTSLKVAAHDPNQNVLPEAMNKLLFHTSFTEPSFEEIVGLIGDDPAPYERMEALLKCIEQRAHKVMPEKANRVVSQLADRCNPELRKWILFYWETLTNNSSAAGYTPTDH